jgi:Mn2+/Fe2+ NRAMP family transporter
MLVSHELGGTIMALNNRTKLGITVAIAVLAGLTSVWLAVLVLVLAALLIAGGQAPERTETFVGGLPGGNYLLKALDKLDAMLPD